MRKYQLNWGITVSHTSSVYAFYVRFGINGVHISNSGLCNLALFIVVATSASFYELCLILLTVGLRQQTVPRAQGADELSSRAPEKICQRYDDTHPQIPSDTRYGYVNIYKEFIKQFLFPTVRQLWSHDILGGQGVQRADETRTREADEEIDALKKLVEDNRSIVNENREDIKEMKAMLQELLSKR